MKLRYEQGVELVGAVGLKEIFLPPLRKLGKIRNNFAHRLGTTLSRPREDEFLNSFDEMSHQIAKQTYAKLNRTMPANRPSKLANLETPDRFVLYVVCLRAALTAARQELQSLTAHGC